MSSYITCAVCPKKVHYKEAFLPDGRRVGGSDFDLAFGNQIGAGNGIMGALVSGVQGKLPPVVCSISCLNSVKASIGGAGATPVQQTKVVRESVVVQESAVSGAVKGVFSGIERLKEQKNQKEASQVAEYQQKLEELSALPFPDTAKELIEAFHQISVMVQWGEVGAPDEVNKAKNAYGDAMLDLLKSYKDAWSIQYTGEENYAVVLQLFEKKIKDLHIKKWRTIAILLGLLIFMIVVVFGGIGYANGKF